IRAEAHTSDVGPDDKNMELSRQRANAVRKYLTDKGIEAKRVQAAGRGEEQPLQKVEGLARKEADEARKKNERVEIAIVKVDMEKRKAPPKSKVKTLGGDK